jgi:xanthine dehydrogenase YagT iron-sulfur-binding subunit
MPEHDVTAWDASGRDGRVECRCTGYIKYHEAVRAVILADPGRYLS